MTTDNKQPDIQDEPTPAPKKRSNALIYAVLGVLLLITIWPAIKTLDTRGRQPSASTRATPRSQAGTAIVNGSGTGDGVSRDFTVPSGCARQNLTYTLSQTDRDDGWVNFRAVSDSGRAGDSAGPFEIDDSPSGTALMTLSPGTYAMEVTAWHADWSYKLACR